MTNSANKKVNIWIFSGDSPGVFLSLGKLPFICGSGFCLLLPVFLGMISAYLIFGSAQGSFLWQDNLKNHALANQVAKLNAYESKLKLKVSKLDKILENILALSFGSSATTNSLNKHGGVGGGDRPFKSIKTHFSVKSQLTSNNDKKISLTELLDSRIKNLKQIPLGTPVLGEITSGFGRRHSPFSGRMQLHTGIDIAADYKTPVVATADGVVVKAGLDGAYGRMVVIEHGNGLETVYGHFSKVTVIEGQQIFRGQRIGLAGSSGRSTGPHVHYEVRVDGVAKDPGEFIKLASDLKATI